MHNDRSEDMLTRRAALMLAAAAPQLVGQTGEKPVGRPVVHYTMFYVEVEDVQAALDKAVELGGKTLVKPIAIPTGTFAWLADPEGNMIGLLKAAKS